MFNRRTWLARIGTGLNKFIIGAKDADGKQALVNSPDSVTQEGDVISANNLNDLEGRIESEFNNKVNLSSTINDRSLESSIQLFDWDIKRGNLAINALTAFAESGLLPYTDYEVGPSAMSGDEQLILPDIGYKELIRFRFAKRKEDKAVDTVRNLKVRLPVSVVNLTEETARFYIGKWTRWSGAWHLRAYERENIALRTHISPTYTPTVDTANFSQEALLHIIKENYGGYKDKALEQFGNNRITFDTGGGISGSGGAVSASGGIASKGSYDTGSIPSQQGMLGDLNITGDTDSSSDEGCPYAGITCCLWLYRVK